MRAISHTVHAASSVVRWRRRRHAAPARRARRSPTEARRGAPPEPAAAGPAAPVLRVLRFGVVMSGLLAVLTVPEAAFFQVRRLEVTGTHALSPDAVAALAGIAPGRPLASVRPADAAARLQAHPRISAARVGVRWPDAVVIEVTERTPRLAVAGGGRYALVADDGVVVAVAADPAGLPVLDDRVAPPPALAPGARAPTAGVRAARQVLDALPAPLAGRVVRVVVREGGEVTLVFVPELVVRAVLRDDLPNRLARLPQALEALAAQGIVPRIVDLRYAGSLVVTPVRGGDGR